MRFPLFALILSRRLVGRRFPLIRGRVIRFRVRLFLVPWVGRFSGLSLLVRRVKGRSILRPHLMSLLLVRICRMRVFRRVRLSALPIVGLSRRLPSMTRTRLVMLITLRIPVLVVVRVAGVLRFVVYWSRRLLTLLVLLENTRIRN